MAVVSLLASIADLKASQLAGGVAPVMPSGVILPYGGATAPTGWLLCDGSTKSRTDYADLFAAIGTAHGSGDGSTTFHLPDLRGRFLRGVSGDSANDPDKTTRTAANTGGNTGNAVGSVQINATKKNGLTATANSSIVTGTTNLAHTHGSSTVTGGTTDVSHSHSSSSVSGSVGSDGTHTHRSDGLVGYLSYTFNTWTASGVAGGGTYGFGYGQHAVSDSNSQHGHGFSLNAAGQSLGATDKSLANGSAGGQSLGTTNISIASGSAAAQAITVGNGDAETRPLNANVNYIIKV